MRQTPILFSFLSLYFSLGEYSKLNQPTTVSEVLGNEKPQDSNFSPSRPVTREDSKQQERSNLIIAQSVVELPNNLRPVAVIDNNNPNLNRIQPGTPSLLPADNVDNTSALPTFSKIAGLDR